MFRLVEIDATHEEPATAVRNALSGREIVGCWRIVMGGPSRTIGLVVGDACDTVPSNETPYRILPGVPGLDTVTAINAPFFEVRTYELLSAEALEAAIAGWRDNVAYRLAIAPILGVFHSTGPGPLRLLHIYPYASMAERAEIRRLAIATGHWPPPGGGARNRRMHSEIAVSIPLSGRSA